MLDSLDRQGGCRSGAVIEAAEQTVLQRAIPFERRGRVFGFSQLVENAAAPLTALLMARSPRRCSCPR